MVTVVGSLNTDLVAYVSKIPRVGETLVGHRYTQSLGGKGANQAVAIAKLGMPVSLIGCVGCDDRGTELVNALSSYGVNGKNITCLHDYMTGVALIQVDSLGNNSIIVVSGANAMLSEEHINLSIKAIEDASVVVAQLEVPTQSVNKALKIAKDLGKRTILNPAPADMFGDTLISYTDILVPNEIELETISRVKIEKDRDIYLAAGVLLNKGIRDLIVTLGERGCIHFNESGSKEYSARKVEAVDTTAAGDSFVGALATAICEGKDLPDAIIFANVVGALTVTKSGAMSSLPSRDDVTEFLKYQGVE